MKIRRREISKKSGDFKSFPKYNKKTNVEIKQRMVKIDNKRDRFPKPNHLENIPIMETLSFERRRGEVEEEIVLSHSLISWMLFFNPYINEGSKRKNNMKTKETIKTKNFLFIKR